MFIPLCVSSMVNLLCFREGAPWQWAVIKKNPWILCDAGAVSGGCTVTSGLTVPSLFGLLPTVPNSFKLGFVTDHGLSATAHAQSCSLV